MPHGSCISKLPACSDTKTVTQGSEKQMVCIISAITIKGDLTADAKSLSICNAE